MAEPVWPALLTAARAVASIRPFGDGEVPAWIRAHTFASALRRADGRTRSYALFLLWRQASRPRAVSYSVRGYPWYRPLCDWRLVREIWKRERERAA